MNARHHLAHLLLLLDRIPSGSLLHLLSLQGFEAVAHLATRERLVSELACLAEATDVGEEHLRVIDGRNLAIVAQRLLLGRFPADIERLSKLWQAHGTPQEVVNLAVRVSREALECWAGQEPNQSRLLAAHAEFVAGLGEIQGRDLSGPLGRAVATSRYRGAKDRDGPALPGETRHPGFPILLEGAPDGFCRSAWVDPEFEPLRPTWVGELDEAVCPELAAESGRWQRLNKEWRDLQERTARGLVPDHPEKLAGAGGGCPEWLALAALRFDCDALRSAELSLVMHALATAQGRCLPAGVGFSGAVAFPGGPWKTACVRGVRGLSAKLQAAREAGIFVLFACRSSNEPSPMAVVGVRLELLDEGEPLPSVITTINTVCASLGLTEHRWRWVEERMRDRLQALAVTAGAVSPLLRDAINACPVGVAPRPVALEQLRQARRTGTWRFPLFLSGPPRSGKSTLLSAWVHDDKDWPRFPVWFSFQRGRAGAETLDDLRSALVEQVEARFCVLLPEFPVPGSAHFGGGGEEERVVLLRRLAGNTRAAVDVVVDGLDEAEPGQQDDVLAALLRLPGKGVVVIGTQDIPRQPGAGAGTVGLRPDREVSLAILDGFARHFSASASETLRGIGHQLAVPYWRDGLAQGAGDNPWVLTDFLRAVGEDRWSWPLTPAEARLTPDVRHYCRVVFQEVADHHPEADRAEVRVFLAGLAVVEEQEWELTDVLHLLGLSSTAIEQERWRDRLGNHLRRLVSSRDERILFLDATFRDVLREGHADLNREVAERLLGLLAANRPANASPALATYAVRHAAAHVRRAAGRAPDLVGRLLFETDWASLRLEDLAETGQSLAAMFTELRQLTELLTAARTDEKPAADALFRALSAWQGAIEQSRESARRWWCGLADIQQFAMWRRQNRATESRARPQLLTPAAGGYRLPSWVVQKLSGLACELLPAPAGVPGTLVFATTFGGLLVAEYDAENFRYLPPWPWDLKVRSIHDLASLDGCRLLAIVEDESEERLFLEIDVARHEVAPSREIHWQGEGRGVPFACEILGEPAERTENPWLLVASRLDGKTRVGVWHQGEEKSRSELDFTFPENRLVGRRNIARFAPWTWAVWGEGREGNEHFFGLEIQTLRGGAVVDLLDPGILIEFAHIHGIFPGPGGRLGLFHDKADGTGCLLQFAADGQFAAPPSLYPPRLLEGKKGRQTPDPFGYFEYCPVVWHDRLGLLILTAVDYALLCPGANSLPRRLPPDLEQAIGHFETTSCGLRLSGERVLLVLDSGGIVVEADGRTVSHVGTPGIGRGDQSATIVSVGCKDGSLVIQRRDSYETCHPPHPLKESHLPDNRLPSAKPAAADVAKLPNSNFWDHTVLDRVGSDGTRFSIVLRYDNKLEEQLDVLIDAKAALEALRSQLGKRLTGSNDPLFRTAAGLSSLTGLEDPLLEGGLPSILNLHNGGEAGWILTLGEVGRGDDGQFLRVRELAVNPATNIATASQLRQEIPLRDEAIGGDRWPLSAQIVIAGKQFLAVAYSSGRIEILSLAPGEVDERRVRAVAFTPTTPLDMALSESDRGRYLAVVADEVYWFDLAELIAGTHRG